MIGVNGDVRWHERGSGPLGVTPKPAHASLVCADSRRGLFSGRLRSLEAPWGRGEEGVCEIYCGWGCTPCPSTAPPRPLSFWEQQPSMVTALLVGLVVGFVLAMPPGPIAIACLRQALAGQAREGLALALSASAMDIGYALLAAFASSALVGALRGLVTDNAWYLLAFQGGCIVVLVVLGLRYCRPTGVLIALTNLASPTFLPSLIFAMSLLHARG